MLIRKAELGDAGEICRICSSDLGYECSKELVSKRMKDLDERREAVFAAEANGAVVGFIHAEIYNVLYFESMVNILGLAVSSEYRRQGIGKALLTRAEEWAAENGIKIIRLNSGISRTEAHKFYRAMGYNGEKEQKRFIKELHSKQY